MSKKVKEKVLVKLVKLLDKMYKYKTMISYFLKCKKDTENINPRILKTSNGKTMLLSKCAICGSKIARFITEQETSGLLISLGIKTKFYF